MRGDLLLDGRNMLNPETVAAAGLRYEGIGRGARAAAKPKSNRARAGRMVNQSRSS
jgi:hypothetical protein